MMRKLGLLFCLLCPFVLYSCLLLESSSIEYTFDNKSSYSVQIILSEPYKVESGSSSPALTDQISVYSKSEKKVFINSGDVDFQWATSYAGDVSKVYCSTSGSKATFRDRNQQ